MKYSICVIILLLSLDSYGQSHPQTTAPILPNTAKAKIDAIFQKFNNLNSPGYAIGIVKGTKVIYTKGYGSANLDYNIPITANSGFDIASVSKQFTAACIALLIMDGKLTLDDPICRFIPELSKYKDTIRIKHLIYNTSGITDYFKLPRPDGHTWITFNYFDIDYCIKTSLTPDTLAFKPGDKWDYCNVNFMLLTKIVEKVSGMAFADFAKKRLFEPLGMMNTLVNDDVTEIIKNRVTPYNPRNKEYVEAYGKEGIKISSNGKWIQHTRNSPHYGGSGVVTTVNDLLLWSENFFTRKFGGDAFYNLMHKTLKFKHDKDNQAFGLYFGKYQNRTYVAWDGGDFGVSAQLIRFPDQKTAIVVLSNVGTGEAYKKANDIADVLIKSKVL